MCKVALNAKLPFFHAIVPWIHLRKNIARVWNCRITAVLNITLLNSFLSFCLFFYIVLYFCLFSFCLFVFLSFCLFVQTSLWSNVWRVSKVTLWVFGSEWPTDHNGVGIELPGQLKRINLLIKDKETFSSWVYQICVILKM